MALHVHAQASPSASDAQAERRGADVLVIRFEVDDSLTSLPPALLDLVGQEAEQNMAEAYEGEEEAEHSAHGYLFSRTATHKSSVTHD